LLKKDDMRSRKISLRDSRRCRRSCGVEEEERGVSQLLLIARLSRVKLTLFIETLSTKFPAYSD
jgi:hypothetical protein